MLLRGVHSLAWIFIIIQATTGEAGNVEKLSKLCADPSKGPRCERKATGGKVSCRKDYKSLYHKEYWEAKVVVLCWWSDWYLNPEEILSLFPLAQKLVIRNGNVSDFLTDFPPSDSLKTLIMRNLLLEALRPTLLSLLLALKHLDLRDNRLSHLDGRILFDHPSLSKVQLSGNPWDCTTDLKWTLNSVILEKLVNATEMICGDSTYPGKPVKRVMFLIQAMESKCPTDICSCSMLNIVWDTNQNYLVPVITVNCSGRGLLELPSRLPLNTTSLVLKRNNITDLLPLVKENIYNDIADIYLDDNSIRNIDVLEGAVWMTRFRVLSLKGNHLKQLPTYALDNAFEKNTNLVGIYLGGNPWKCDCMFTSDFQHLLIKYRSVVKDKQDIRCAEKEGDENALVPVLEISLGSVCVSSNHDINPLDVLSAVLAFLIVLVIGKLMYDYWTFKRTGKLPWIVAKMP